MKNKDTNLIDSALKIIGQIIEVRSHQKIKCAELNLILFKQPKIENTVKQY